MQYSSKEGQGAFIASRFQNVAPSGELAPASPADPLDVPGRFPWSLHACDSALTAATEAKRAWARTKVEDRIPMLLRYQEALKKRKTELIIAIARSIGKPVWEATTEVDAMIAKVDITVGPGRSLLTFESDPGTSIRLRPIGVCVVLGPFNFPGHLANGHIVPALLLGNTVVYKPSEKAPEVGELMAEAFGDAGFPPGVFNMVQGGAEVAERLVQDPRVDGIMFTGSTHVGKKILASSAVFPGRMIALELGGRNAAIVTPSANIVHAVREIAFAAYVTAGQRCTANSRVLVHEDCVDKFVALLAETARHTKVGKPSDGDNFLGPVIEERTIARIDGLVKEGEGEFEAIVPVRRLKLPGNFISPAVYRASVARPSSSLARDELFAPVVTVETYREEDDAIARTNDSEYGLAAAVFTSQRSQFDHFAGELDVGICNWNRSTVGSSSKLPFGGRKNSGNHRPAGLFSSFYCTDVAAEIHVAEIPAEAKLSPGLYVGGFGISRS
ncbi:MAG: aldehyde dehydrogenase family protein [Polyangiaceae bacterium]|nr:aldehyde dehydrogenase family protein [Polyangiaceae bacterium]